jgi:hypothetical protein
MLKINNVSFDSRTQMELRQAAMRLTCVREVLVSNLCHDTNYNDWGGLWFPSVPATKWQGTTLKYAKTTSVHNFFTFLFTVNQ